MTCRYRSIRNITIEESITLFNFTLALMNRSAELIHKCLADSFEGQLQEDDAVLNSVAFVEAISRDFTDIDVIANDTPVYTSMVNGYDGGPGYGTPAIALTKIVGGEVITLYLQVYFKQNLIAGFKPCFYFMERHALN